MSSSKFKHVFAEFHKEKYDDISYAVKQTESTGVRGNEKFIAFPWQAGGGGSLCVIPNTAYGKMNKQSPPLITGHTGSILDFEFNPFDDNLLATASEDCTIKLWQLPDEQLKEHMKEPVATLDGHGKKVLFSAWHPCASGVLASTAFDKTVKLWNAAVGEEQASVDIPENCWHLKWNYDGSLLCAPLKDAKQIMLLDPRQQDSAQQWKGHEGAKAMKCEFASDSMLITTGFSAQAERQVGLWDIRNTGSPISLEVIDQGTGAMLPFYDESTHLLFLAAKGDGNVRFYDITAEEPYYHYLSQAASSNPARGFDFLPKRCVDTTKCEIMKGLKVESNCIIPVSFILPRKSDAFQEDVYPDAPAGEPSATADEYFAGENRAPKLGSLNPKKRVARKAGGMKIKTAKELMEEMKEKDARIKELEAEVASLKAQLGQ